MSLQLFSLILILCINTSLPASVKPKVILGPGRVNWQFKSCEIPNLEECSQMTMLYGYRGHILAKNRAEMPEWCEETRLAMNCVTEWGRNCIEKRLLKQVMALVLKGAKKSRKQICSTKGTKYYLENFDCTNKTLSEQHDCIDKLREDVINIMRVKDKNLWIHQGCCFVDKWKKCFDSVTRKHCSKSGVKFLKWAADPYLTDMMDLFCKPELTWNSRDCKEVIKAIPKNNDTKNRVKYKSLVYPVYKMISDFINEKGLDDFDEI